MRKESWRLSLRGKCLVLLVLVGVQPVGLLIEFEVFKTIAHQCTFTRPMRSKGLAMPMTLP